MGYLNDTCVFIKKINTAKKILDLAIHCKSKGKRFCVTDIVRDELIPGNKVPKDDANISKNTLSNIKFGTMAGFVECINVKDPDSKFYENYNKIRKRYYSHLKDPSFVKSMVEKGEISEEDFKNKSYRYKDIGECSCIAVAMEEPDKYIIISEDKGRVFLKPKINLFDKFKKSHGITVLNYDEWIKVIGFEEDGQVVNA